MSPLLTLIIPLGLVIGFSILFGLWTAPCHPEGRKKETHLTSAGTVLALLSVIWLTLVGFSQSSLPVITPGQLLATLGVLIWVGHSYVQHQINQRKLTMLPLGASLLMIAAGLAVGLESSGTLPEDLIHPRAAVHIALSITAITLLIGSGVFGAGEIILHRQIKSRSFGRWFHNLPSLSDLNRLRRLSLTAGWILITISLVSALSTLWLMPGTREATYSHLHPMLMLWAIVTALWAADRFRWLAQQKLAFASLAVSAVMVLLIVISVVEFFGGGAA